MRFSINTGLCSDFEEVIDACKKSGAGIELHHTHAKKKFLDSPGLKKMDVDSIEGKIRDYKYLIFLGQSLGCEYVLFHPEKKDLKKMPEIIMEGDERGVKIALSNSPLLGRTATDFYNILKSIPGAGLVFSPAHARLCNQHPKSFMNMLKDEIVSVSVSDVYKKDAGLPYSLGERDFLDPVIQELGKKKRFVVTLNQRYSVEDALISMEKIAERAKHLKTI